VKPAARRTRRSSSAAIGAGNHVLVADRFREVADTLRDQFRVLDQVGGVADHARHDELVAGQLDLLPQRPLVLMPHITGLEAASLRAHLQRDVDDLLERQVVGVGAVPGAPAEMVAHAVGRNA